LPSLKKEEMQFIQEANAFGHPSEIGAELASMNTLSRLIDADIHEGQFAGWDDVFYGPQLSEITAFRQ
jgi:hypothetical protein